MGIFSLFQTILNKFTKNMRIDEVNLKNDKYYTEVIVFSDDDYNGKIEDRSYILNSILPYYASFKEVEKHRVSTTAPALNFIKHTVRLRYHPVDRTSTFADNKGNPISDRVIDDILRPTNDDFLFVRNIDGTLSIFNLKTNEFYYNNKFIIDNHYYNNINISDGVGRWRTWNMIHKVYKHFGNGSKEGYIFPLVFKNDKDEICVLNGRLVKSAANVRIIIDGNSDQILLGIFNLISPYIYVNNRRYKIDFKYPKKMDLPIAHDVTSYKYFICDKYYPSVLDKYIDKDKLAQTIADIFDFVTRI